MGTFQIWFGDENSMDWVRGKGESGVKDTPNFWCKQLGGAVPVTEGGAPEEVEIWGAY